MGIRRGRSCAPDHNGLTGHWLSAVGILAPLPLAPEIDSSILVGLPLADRLFRYDGHPIRIYVRTITDRDGAGSLPSRVSRMARQPEQAQVSRPSGTLTARLAVKRGGCCLAPTRYLGRQGGDGR